jgi:hypothetical protein
MASGQKMLIAKIPAREWKGLVPEWAGGRLHIALQCHRCGEQDHWSAAQMIGPDRVVPKIIQLGWEANGKVTCPKCVMMRRSNVVPIERKEAPVATVAKIPTSTMIDEQKKNKRLVILALEDYYDEPKGRYRDGKSDATVADELSLSAGFVANVREEFYGKLLEPDEIGELRASITTQRKSLDALELKLEGLCQRNGWKV